MSLRYKIIGSFPYKTDLPGSSIKFNIEIPQINRKKPIYLFEQIVYDLSKVKKCFSSVQLNSKEPFVIEIKLKDQTCPRTILISNFSPACEPSIPQNLHKNSLNSIIRLIKLVFCIEKGEKYIEEL